MCRLQFSAFEPASENVGVPDDCGLDDDSDALEALLALRAGEGADQVLQRNGRAGDNDDELENSSAAAVPIQLQLNTQPGSTRYHCPFPGCKRSFAELWRLKVHYRAPPNIRGSGKERGHGMRLTHCPKCGDALKVGGHHVKCAAVAKEPQHRESNYLRRNRSRQATHTQQAAAGYEAQTDAASTAAAAAAGQACGSQFSDSAAAAHMLHSSVSTGRHDRLHHTPAAADRSLEQQQLLAAFLQQQQQHQLQQQQQQQVEAADGAYHAQEFGSSGHQQHASAGDDCAAAAGCAADAAAYAALPYSLPVPRTGSGSEYSASTRLQGAGAGSPAGSGTGAAGPAVAAWGPSSSSGSGDDSYEEAQQQQQQQEEYFAAQHTHQQQEEEGAGDLLWQHLLLQHLQQHAQQVPGLSLSELIQVAACLFGSKVDMLVSAVSEASEQQQQQLAQLISRLRDSA